MLSRHIFAAAEANSDEISRATLSASSSKRAKQDTVWTPTNSEITIDGSTDETKTSETSSRKRSLPSVRSERQLGERCRHLRILRLDGNCSADTRARELSDFHEGKADVFLVSTKVMYN